MRAATAPVSVRRRDGRRHPGGGKNNRFTGKLSWHTHCMSEQSKSEPRALPPGEPAVQRADKVPDQIE